MLGADTEFLGGLKRGEPLRLAGLHGSTFGGGVIGNTTGSGPVIGGSSPPLRARGDFRVAP